MRYGRSVHVCACVRVQRGLRNACATFAIDLNIETQATPNRTCTCGSEVRTLLG